MPMKEVVDELETWTGAGERVALATVVRTRRSAPRPPGAKMAINERGAVAGAVSGGCVEGTVAEAALELLRGDGEPRMLHFGIADSEAWDVGLPCGGETRLGGKLLVREDGSTSGGLGDDALDDPAREACEELLWAERSELRELAGAEVFIDVVAPPPRLLILGAVEYAAALCRVARAAGWRPYVCDPRAAFATRERFPEAEEVVAAWPDEAFERLGIDRVTYIAILTHDPKLDDAALRIALRSDAAYVGAMGSRRAQARRRERLLEAGMSEAELDRLAAPIGLDLGATSPEETALSIMGEAVAVRNGHDGGRLGRAVGRIHEVGA